MQFWELINRYKKIQKAPIYIYILLSSTIIWYGSDTVNAHVQMHSEAKHLESGFRTAGCVFRNTGYEAAKHVCTLHIAICHVFQLSSCLGVTCSLYLRSPLSYLFFLCSLPSSSLACREDTAICTISLSLRRHACLFCTYQRTRIWPRNSTKTTAQDRRPIFDNGASTLCQQAKSQQKSRRKGYKDIQSLAKSV